MIDRTQIYNLTFDGIDPTDHPDYCDVYIASGMIDERELTDEELEILNDDRDFVHEEFYKYKY